MNITNSTQDNETQKNKGKYNLTLRRLRISLKYRPEILRLILKLRHCIKKKNCSIIKLKDQLKMMKNNPVLTEHSSSQYDETDFECSKNKVNNDYEQNNESINKFIANKINSSSQTDDTSFVTSNLNISAKVDKGDAIKLSDDASINKNSSISVNVDNKKESTLWNINDNGENEKSIADQVKEVAQNALQQSGMVYVESAGMYYDYKTGYYYNSELGLYYHTDTGCYYYYSDEKQTFVFHSYPDRSATIENTLLNAHERRKAKKHKKAWKTEDAIDNLTKNLSQEEDASGQGSNPKRKKKANKTKVANENEASEIKNKEQHSDSTRKVTDKVDDSNIEMTASEVKDTNIEEGEIIEKKDDSKNQELEDGECSESEESNVEDDESDASTSTASGDEYVAKHHPPCMRVIVRETNLPKLKVGSLFLVTKDGGTVGREGEHHTILIRDTNVSRNHLDIKYDVNRKMYTATDLGSKNGTILNGTRMSESQIISDPIEVIHGSTIQLGETKLLCHIHPGLDTCGHCEPGLVMETQEKEKKVAYTRTCSVQKQHQLELARLRNKYAPRPLAIEAAEYNDRAQARRDQVGSSHHAEKTQATDVDTFIAPENKGFKLLEKMGWSKGEGLGKDNQGDTEPIPLVSNEGKAGLGTTGATAAAPAAASANTLGPATLRLASRTKMLKPPAKAFQQPLDDDSE